MVSYIVVAVLSFITGFYVARKISNNHPFENPNTDIYEMGSGSLPVKQLSDLECELSDEENNRQANLLSKISTICEMLESIANDAVTHEYSRDKVIERVTQAEEILSDISDSFYYDAASHQIINILCKAKMFEKAKVHFSNVSDDMIRSQVIEDNPELTSSYKSQ
jgi:hypothetical protein